MRVCIRFGAHDHASGAHVHALRCVFWGILGPAFECLGSFFGILGPPKRVSDIRFIKIGFQYREIVLQFHEMNTDLISCSF